MWEGGAYINALKGTCIYISLHLRNLQRGGGGCDVETLHGGGGGCDVEGQ